MAWVTALTLCLTFVVATGMYQVGVAHAQATAAAQSVGSGSGSAVAVPAPLPDPATNPLGFAEAVVQLWHSGGWATALMLVLVGLLEAAAALGKDTPSLAWLGKGRVSLAIGGGLAVATAALAALTGQAQWSAVLVAAVSAALAFWHQAGTDPARA